MSSVDNHGSSSSDMMVDEEERKDSYNMDEDGQKVVANQGSETCKVCYAADADAAFIPCGHVTACIRCAQRCNICPVCRTPYHDIMKLYR
jgi:baculoviral IAP repeat-containing protein 7/8